MTWVFNKQVAEEFPVHARAHIPHYEEVISQSVDICRRYGPQASIIDIGVATGETINSLYLAGFRNLVGVDNSQDMLDKCPVGYARLVNSSELPPGDYDVAIMNWTLHFIRDKHSYLRSIWEQLRPGGALVLSEKTSKDGFPQQFYYDFKRRQGVPEDVIRLKEESLRSVMYIDNVRWYLDTLESLGFKQVHIANAYWCFTTFVCLK